MPNPLGEVLRDLLKQRNMKAVELGQKIGVSATSVSKIINGVTRPRQSTFTRMCKELCRTKEEEIRLVSAFVGAELMEEEPAEKLVDDDEIERERAERYLEKKAQSISFRKAVASELDKLGLEYEQEYIDGTSVADFMVYAGNKKVALECKFNIHRDFIRTASTVKILREQLRCDKVYIVVPYLSDSIPHVSLRDGDPSGAVITPNDLKEIL